MSFTAEQITALEALEAAFGPFPDANPEHVEALYIGSYERSVPQYAGYAVEHWKAAELAANPDLSAIKQEIRAEKARINAIKNAHRAQDIRENLVSGILSGLIPKARKAGTVEFNITKEQILLEVWDDLNLIISMGYDRADYRLEATLNGDDLEIEDWTALNGNARPRDQSVALLAVYEFLEGLDV